MSKSNKRKLNKKILIVRTAFEFANKLIEAKLKEQKNHLMFPIYSMQLTIHYEQKIRAISNTPSSHFKADKSGRLDKRRIKKSKFQLVGAVNSN